MRAGFATADALPEGAFVAINITAEALVSTQIQELFRQRERYDNIVLEISEKDTQEPGVAEALTPFRAGGGRLAVDDIGSGFCNLRDVLTLKPDILKVDRAIVRGVDRDRVKSAIVEGLNTMAARLDIPLLAEGIESREELAELERLGVPLGQGYLFGEPSPSFTGEAKAGLAGPAAPVVLAAVVAGDAAVDAGAGSAAVDLAVGVLVDPAADARVERDHVPHEEQDHDREEDPAAACECDGGGHVATVRLPVQRVL